MPHRSSDRFGERNDQVYTCFPNLLIKAAYWQKVQWKEKSITVQGKNSDVNSCSKTISVMYAK